MTFMCVPGVRTEFLRSFPFYSFPTAWNFLLSEFKEIAQKSIFKHYLNAKLLDNLKDIQCENYFVILAPPFNSHLFLCVPP